MAIFFFLNWWNFFVIFWKHKNKKKIYAVNNFQDYHSFVAPLKCSIAWSFVDTTTFPSIYYSFCIHLPFDTFSAILTSCGSHTKGTICKKNFSGWIFNWAFCRKRSPCFFGFDLIEIVVFTCVYVLFHPFRVESGEKSPQSLAFLLLVSLGTYITL